MSKYAQRDTQGAVTGYCAYPAADTDQTPIDEQSQEWLAYVAAQENPVPVEVGKAQAYTALYNIGMLDAVMAWIAADPLRQIQVNALNAFRRDSAMMEAGRVALGWTPEQLDALFVAADQVVI